MGPRLLPLLITPLLLVACTEQKEPQVRASADASDCHTEGTLLEEPAPTVREAVEPYLQPGQTARLMKQIRGSTATVHLEEQGGGVVVGVVMLVRTEKGWAATKVERC